MPVKPFGCFPFIFNEELFTLYTWPGSCVCLVVTRLWLIKLVGYCSIRAARLAASQGALARRHTGGGYQMELMQASRQWASRPADERFTSLTDMQSHFQRVRESSRAAVLSNRQVTLVPESDNKGLMVAGPNGGSVAPTHWSFGQLAQLAEAPAGYLRTLPSPIAADCLNYGLRYKRNIEEIGVLLYKNGGTPTLRAATGPRYGRIWNSDILRALTERFGDGRTGEFRVPGEFGKAVEITPENTTLFAGDRDMFVFLADEEHRIEVPARRDGEPGTLGRGFFVWNSEVGATTFGLGTFLFDYVCANRIVWGAEHYSEIKIRHSAGAPDRFLEEVGPALHAYAAGSTAPVVKLISDARAARVDDVGEFLAQRFGKRTVASIIEAHEIDERRPMETLWDVATGITAHARTVAHQDKRVEMEREAGRILDLA